MSKIMLVEDDNNLREIYEARLAAEGYEIVSAPDGEAALALGVKEKPDLIIADIMMPKVSGFDMLDIMRTTNETKNAKIIMMTALNQAEDKAKAEQLGADLYLVKSQVTLEDVVRSAKKLLGEETPLNIGGVPVEHPEASGTQPQNTTSMTEPTASVPQATNTPTPPTTPNPAPAAQPTAPATPVEPQQPSQPAATPTAEPAQAPQPAPTPAPIAEPPQPATPAPKEEKPDDPKANEASSNAASKSSEEELLQKQIEQFITKENPTISTDATANPVEATQPAQAPQTAPTPAPIAEPPQPATPAPTQSAPGQKTATPAPTMAAPPRDMPANDPQTTALSDDKPAGERQIQKNSDGEAAEGGIAQNAEISGRKKVIKPISDVLTKGPDLNALLEKEKAAQPGTAPTVNSVVSPEGVTSTPNQKGPSMSDVIAPNPSAAPKLDPNNPPAPPVA